MEILNEQHQQQILLSYQKDYGSMIISYNDLGLVKNKAAMNILRMQAENLRNEILKDTSLRKSCFNEQNAEFAKEIAKTIENFITTRIDTNSNNIAITSYNSGVHTFPSTLFKADRAA